jgi:hypothetical protein
MFGSRVSSCCKSASITATIGAEVARMPSTQALDSPRRPMRCKARTCGSRCAMARTTSAVPSRESSSTNTTSQSRPASTRCSRSTSTGTLALSFSVGTTTASARPLHRVAGAAAPAPESACKTS